MKAPPSLGSPATAGSPPSPSRERAMLRLFYAHSAQISPGEQGLFRLSSCDSRA